MRLPMYYSNNTKGDFVMTKVKIKIKTPSKAKIQREFTKAIRKNLTCFNCGRKLPSGVASTVTCPSCGATTRLK